MASAVVMLSCRRLQWNWVSISTSTNSWTHWYWANIHLYDSESFVDPNIEEERVHQWPPILLSTRRRWRLWWWWGNFQWIGRLSTSTWYVEPSTRRCFERGWFEGTTEKADNENAERAPMHSATRRSWLQQGLVWWRTSPFERCCVLHVSRDARFDQLDKIQTNVRRTSPWRHVAYRPLPETRPIWVWVGGSYQEVLLTFIHQQEAKVFQYDNMCIRAGQPKCSTQFHMDRRSGTTNVRWSLMELFHKLMLSLERTWGFESYRRHLNTATYPCDVLWWVVRVNECLVSSSCYR